MIVLAGIGVFIYFHFFAKTPSITVAPAGSAGLPVAGRETTATNGSNGSTNPSAINSPVAVTPRLVEISAGPVVPGEVAVDVLVPNASSSATSTSSEINNVAINYIERESGNVFLYSRNTNSITRTSNKTIPGIESAEWLPDASVAFVRYFSGDDFSTINTYTLPSNDSSDGFFLSQDITDISVSSTSVLTLASGVNGSVASLGNIDGTHSSDIFTTPLSSLRISFAGKNQYLAFTKPAASLAGDAFLVNASGYFSRIAGPLDGLVALSSHSGKMILVSYTSNNTLQMELINTTTNEVIPLPIATIADKCIWTNDDSDIYCGVPVNPSTNAAYPDDWYQGTLQFSDRIWKIDVAGRFAQLTLDFPAETKGTLDAEALAVDPLNTELVFMNKNDGSLWSYQL